MINNDSSSVFVIRLANPPLNILNQSTRVALLRDLENATEDASVKVIVIVGSHAAFSVGADITEMDMHIGNSQSAKRAALDSYVEAYKSHNLASIVYALDTCPKPVIALITGQCFGGGLELALGCHYRICTSDSQFRFPEALLGIVPGALGTQLLPRLVSFETCVRMCTGTCEMLNASAALAAGLVDQVLREESEGKGAGAGAGAGAEAGAGAGAVSHTGSSSSTSKSVEEKRRLENYLARTVRVLRRQLERPGNEDRPALHPYRRTSTLPVVTSSLADSSRIAFQAMRKLPPADRGGRASRGALDCLLACIQHQKNFIAGARVESDVSRRLVVSDEAQALRWAFFAQKASASFSAPASASISTLSSGAGRIAQTQTQTQTQATERQRPATTESNAGSSVSDFSGESSSRRRAKAILPLTFSVGVVGSGLMGSGIAAAVLLSSSGSSGSGGSGGGSISVILCDVSLQALERARGVIEKIIHSAVAKKRLTPSAGQQALSQLRISQELQALSQVDFVIEAVFEDYEVKKDLFRRLDAICAAHTVLCSNTSSLDVDVLAKQTRRPDKVLGLHFFSPAHVMRLLEVVVCEHTSQASLDLTVQLVRRIKKTGVLVRNLPGFVGNRMIFVYATEAMLLLEDGATVQQVDSAMRSFGMAMGPFEMADLSGLDVSYWIRKEKGLVQHPVGAGAAASGGAAAAAAESGGAKQTTDQAVQVARPDRPQAKNTANYSAIGDELYRLGRLGQKNGKGFYMYKHQRQQATSGSASADSTGAGAGAGEASARGRPVALPDPIVDEVIARESQRKAVLGLAAKERPSSGMYVLSPAIARMTVTDTEIEQRLLYSLVNEGFRLLGENGCISDRPGDIDVVYTHGYGFPDYKGGPMFWAEYHVGLGELLLALHGLFRRFPASPWFEPAPLLVRMVSANVSVYDLQRDPTKVQALMSQSQWSETRSKL